VIGESSIQDSRGLTWCCEFGIVAGISIAFVMLNVSTAMLYPPVNSDEVLFTDPAVNLAMGNGFRSSVWYTQPYNSVYASNAPLYSLLLAAWIWVMGFTPVAVRTLNYILMAIAAIVVWFSVANTGLIGSSRNRLLLLCAVLLGEGVALAYRMGRYDALGILIVSLIWMVGMAQTTRQMRKAQLLFLLGWLLILSGYQNAVFVVLITLLLFRTGRRRVLSVSAPVCLGMACGMLCLLAAYYMLGSIGYLIGSLVHHGHTSRPCSQRVFAALAAASKDHSSLFLLLACAVLALRPQRAARYGRHPVWLALLVLIVMPAIMGFAWSFQDYYGWMKYIPGAVCILVAIDDQSANDRRGKRVWVVQGIVALACLGFPARLAIAAAEHETWDYDDVQRFVETNVHETDIVLAGAEAYYPSKRRSRLLYQFSNMRFLSGLQREAISVIIGRPSQAEASMKEIDGQWRMVASYAAPRSAGSFDRIVRRFGWPPYELAAYRRDDGCATTVRAPQPVPFGERHRRTEVPARPVRCR